ncbi:MAG: hypothetical protein J6U04_04305 [Salinivirgaceae bacterium]|nr:hypothetical protein [Salinivirgaceae bacterium]
MKPLHLIQEKKQDLYKNTILVTLLSVGVSLCANYLSKLYESNVFLIVSGIICILIVMIAYVVSFYNSKTYKIKTECVFVTGKDGVLFPINRYWLNEEMYRDLRSVFSENKVYKDLWMKAFSKPIDSESKNKYVPIYKNKEIVGFVGELIEYVFIEWLSLEQSSYFNGFNDSDLKILTRDKVSKYLLQNRVLEMISRPYNEREKLTKDNQPDDEGEVYSMYGDDDVIYNRFDLRLPKNSYLFKENGKLTIKNRNYTLKFTHNFNGFNANLPYGFHKLYLKHNFEDICVYEVSPELEIRLNPFFFLFWKDWKYMKWIDIVSEKFSEDFSFDAFIKRIGYESSLTGKIIDDNKTR